MYKWWHLLMRSILVRRKQRMMSRKIGETMAICSTEQEPGRPRLTSYATAETVMKYEWTVSLQMSREDDVLASNFLLIFSFLNFIWWSNFKKEFLHFFFLQLNNYEASFVYIRPVGILDSNIFLNLLLMISSILLGLLHFLL